MGTRIWKALAVIVFTMLVWRGLEIVFDPPPHSPDCICDPCWVKDDIERGVSK